MIWPIMRNLIRLFSYRSFIISAVVVGLGLLALLARDGLTPLEIGLLLGYVVVCVALRLGLRTPPARRAAFDALAAFDNVLAGGRPSLLEFYSDNCAVCLMMRPILDNLESDTHPRLQTLRVDLNSDIGRQLADRYGVTLSPTFILFDRAGRKQEEFLLVLDRARVLYWLNQQAPAA